MIVSGVVAGPFTTGRARLAAAIVIALGAATYAEQCHRTPYAECWHCGGLGYRRRYRPRILAWIIGPPSTRCRPCRGRGVRMRWGRALMNAYRRATFTPPGTPDPAPIPNPADAAGPIDVTDAARRAYALDPTRATRPPAP